MEKKRTSWVGRAVLMGERERWEGTESMLL